MPAIFLLEFANGDGGFQSVHLWHLHVHQHQVKTLRGESLDRVAAVFYHYYVVPAFGQHADGHALIHRIVFCQ